MYIKTHTIWAFKELNIFYKMWPYCLLKIRDGKVSLYFYFFEDINSFKIKTMSTFQHQVEKSVTIMIKTDFSL